MAARNNGERAADARMDRRAMMDYARRYRDAGLPGGMDTCAHFVKMARECNRRAIYWQKRARKKRI